MKGWRERIGGFEKPACRLFGCTGTALVAALAVLWMTVCVDAEASPDRRFGLEYTQWCAENTEACALLRSALATASEIPWPREQAQTLAEIAAAEHAVGLIHEADRTLAESLAVARSLGGRTTPDLDAEAIVLGYGPPEAYEVAHGLALGAVARAQVAIGREGDALATLAEAREAERAVTNSLIRWRVQYDIIEIHLRAGFFGEALVVAEELHCCNTLSYALARILRALAEANSEDGMVETIAAASGLTEAMPDPEDRVVAWCAIAAAEFVSGLEQDGQRTFERARDAAGEITVDSELVQALITIARSEDEAGLSAEARRTFAEATVTARGISSEEERSRAYREIVDAQAASGLLEDALAIAAEIQTEAPRRTALMSIAEAQARQGLVADALATADRIDGDGYRKDALIAVARSLTHAGLAPAALSILGDLVPATTESWALREIASVQAELGRFGDALISARQIPVGPGRWQALLGIAEHQAAANRFADALETADEIADEERRDAALKAIAVAQAETGLFDEALDLAAEIGDELSRSHALRRIATAQAAAAVARWIAE